MGKNQVRYSQKIIKYDTLINIRLKYITRNTFGLNNE